MSRQQPDLFCRVHLIDDDGKPVIFYVDHAPSLDAAADEAERWTGATTVVVDDCTPARRKAAA